MSGPPRGPAVGAELAELYKKGRDTLPKVSEPIKGAMTHVYNEYVYAELYRSGDLGLGTYGCHEDFADVRSNLGSLLSGLGLTLEECGVNIMKTAQDLANVDHATETAFKKHGGEL
jgi:hypothetical protein